MCKRVLYCTFEQRREEKKCRKLVATLFRSLLMLEIRQSYRIDDISRICLDSHL